jgi:hypothetical protein
MDNKKEKMEKIEHLRDKKCLYFIFRGFKGFLEF